MPSGSYSETGGNPKSYTRCFHENSVVYPQGLPFRGHGDDQNSNFKQLLNFRGKGNFAFVEWLKKKKRIKATLPLKFKTKC